MPNANELDSLIPWCDAVLGPVAVMADTSREHPGLRASSVRLRGCDGVYYLKIHRDRAHWENEVHAYEHWAAVFGPHAPRLEAVHTGEPLALLMSELPGSSLENAERPQEQHLQVWRDAGQALTRLHAQDVGAFFGPCHRSGTPVGAATADAVAYLAGEFNDWLRRGAHIDALTPEEVALVQAAMQRLPVFAGEPPTPCHRDYCPANWMVDEAGTWAGVIDFEFSYWDVRSADFSRFPEWEWMRHPERMAAFIAGYGSTPNQRFAQQVWVSRVLYALGAIVWGIENDYLGFAAEGREAMRVLDEKAGEYES